MKIHEPAMTFASEEAERIWNKGVEKNQDPYGKAIYRFASEWATRMERAISEGGLIDDLAQDTCRESDDEGITGFMYGAAVSVLSQVWVHGESLRRWHNLATQIGSEGEEANGAGGVLNPAIISIEKGQR